MTSPRIYNIQTVRNGTSHDCLVVAVSMVDAITALETAGHRVTRCDLNEREDVLITRAAWAQKAGQ